MKKIKLVLKRILIVYLIMFITLSSMSQCSARMYDAQCGEYVSKYAKEFIQKYCEGGNTVYAHVGFKAEDAPHWSSGVFGQGTFKADCTNGVHYMYFKALTTDITKYGYGASADAIRNLKGSYAQYWDEIPLSQCKAGDVVLRDGHGEMYIGNNQNANFGSGVNGGGSGKIKGGPGDFQYAFRPKFDVNPAGSLGEAEEEDLNIYDKNGFIYTGVPTISGYKNSPPFGKWIIKMLGEILDYLIGIMTFGVRVVIVGWTAIIERVFMDGIVNAVTGVTDERVDEWKDNPDAEQEEEQEDPNATTAPESNIEPIGTEGEKGYVSEGVQRVGEIGGKIDLNTTSEADVTVENIVYNKIPILDVNFFNFESAGGAVVDKDGIIYLLKTNVAMWYYIFRVLAIAIMLAVLVYTGIRMALSTVAEKKAIYKQMLVDWLVGFGLVFATGFFIYFVIYVNEQFISWVIPKHEDGSEILVYETIRSKAYELKATTGFTGMIMYIMMVYYAIRFLIVYFKRYLTATILALMGPFMAVSYAVEKVNKGGRGGAKKYGDWLRDFLYTILMQSMHALIYTIFIFTALKLTEVSLVGILLSFIFLSFMLKVDPIFRKIFGLTGGKNTGKLTFGSATQAIALTKEGGKVAKNVVKGYGNFVGKTVKPVGTAIGKVGDKLNEISNNYEQQRAIESGKTVEEYKKEKAEKDKKKEEARESRNKKIEGAISGLKIAGGMVKTGALGALALPMFFVETGAGIEILTAAISSSDHTTKMIEEAFKKGQWNAHAYTIDRNRRMKLKGVVPQNERAQEKLAERYRLLGIDYKLVGNYAPGQNIDPNSGGPGGPGGQGGNAPGGNGQGGKGTNGRRGPGPDGPNTPDSPNAPRIGYTFGLPNEVYERLTETQKQNLQENGRVANLKHADEDVMDVEEVLEEQGIEAAAVYAELLAEAEAEEKELEQAYREATDRIDEQIAELEASGNEEMIKLARNLKAKKDKELAETLRILKEPFSEKDIERAIKNYKSQVPQFNENASNINQQDVEGISKQIEKVLREKGVEIEISKDFIAKVEKELRDKKAKDTEEQASRRNSLHLTGQDVTRTMADDVVKGTDLTLKEKIKALNTDDRGYNPYSTSNPNAPRSGAAKPRGANEKLSKGIMNSLRTSSKVKTRGSEAAMSYARSSQRLQEIGQRMAQVTGKNPYSGSFAGRTL